MIAYIPFEATNKVIILKVPILVSKSFPEIALTIKSLASLGKKLLIIPIKESNEMEKREAIKVIKVNIGIKAKTEKKAKFPGRTRICVLLNAFKTFSR